jgi:hypothetical protein
MINLGATSWARHVSLIGKEKMHTEIWLQNVKKKRILGRSRSKLEVNIEMDRRDIVWSRINWIKIARISNSGGLL